MLVPRLSSTILLGATLALAGCGGGSSNETGTSVPLAVAARPAVTAAQEERAASVTSASAEPAVLTGDVANPVTIYIGFKLTELAKSGYGAIAYYGPSSTGQSSLINVSRGSEVQFYNTDTTRHTASGLGEIAFPQSYSNTSGVTAKGTEIRNDEFWSTGELNPRQMSSMFTVAANKVYYFGCYFHYAGLPQMRDAIVAR